MKTANPTIDLKGLGISATLTAEEIERALSEHRALGHWVMMHVLLIHLFIALSLGFVYQTWLVTLTVSACGLAMYMLSAKLSPQSFFTRCMAGIALQVFVALHIYQMHGMAEMNFFFFTACTAMIAYCDWKAMWPGALLIIGQHIVFALLTNSGVNMFFFPDPYINFSKLFFHSGIAIVHVVICGMWAGIRQNQILNDARQRRILRGSLEAAAVAQVQLEDQSIQLHFQNNELAVARGCAEAATRAKSEFLANMSHEIRTPMTAILGYCDILLAEADSDPQLRRHRNSLHIIRQNGDFLLGLLNDILDLSKIEAGKLEVEQIPFSIDTLVADIKALFKMRAAAKNLPLNVQFEGELPPAVESDPARIRQIMLNLVSNAIKFTTTGSVDIVVRMLPGHTPRLQFEVRDTGLGMTPDVMSKLFSAFTQADASVTRKFGGTGLGLSISQRLAQILSGEITVESEPGVGSRFYLTVAVGLPAAAPSPAAPSSAAESPPVKKPPSMELLPAGTRILLVEDGPDNQRLISLLLKKAGAEVIMVDNGELGVRAAWEAKQSGGPFDVILMDMQMPVLDGYQATARLRQEGYTAPIIALTAHAMSGDRQKCLDAGCNDYALKPIERATLMAIIRKHVGRPQLFMTARVTATGT